MEAVLSLLVHSAILPSGNKKSAVFTVFLSFVGCRTRGSDLENVRYFFYSAT